MQNTIVVNSVQCSCCSVMAYNYHLFSSICVGNMKICILINKCGTIIFFP